MFPIREVQQTFDQIKERCDQCGQLPHYIYKCSKCNKNICEGCYPYHKDQCLLINQQHHKSTSQQEIKELTKERQQSIQNPVNKYQCSFCSAYAKDLSV